MKRKSFLFFLLFLSVSISGFSQKLVPFSDVYTVKGLVIDSISNESVPYATLRIALASAPHQPVKLLACDENGKFSTTIDKAGQYVMRMESLGKIPVKKNFVLSESNRTLDLGKLYMNDDTQQLKEVTVTAQKPLVKVEIDKLTYNLEDDPEAKTSNALDMFRKVPLITVDGEDQIQLKGSSNYKIYMNGKPSNLLSGQNASNVLKSMPANSIKNIEVITDPGSKYDAEGIGGIINIITAKNALEGYTGFVRSNVSALGRFGGGGYISLKAGKFGLTANYGYNYYNTPWNESTSERSNFEAAYKDGYAFRLRETGRSKNRGPFQYGDLEASYEIDSLNLLSMNVNLFGGKSKNFSELDAYMRAYPPFSSSLEKQLYRYHRNSFSESTYGSTDVNIDYQHSTRKKDELLTLSYRFSRSPNDSESHTELSEVFDYPLAHEYPKWNINDAATIEHTGQFDYTTPLFKNHTFEGGFKYINRQNKSNTLEQIFDESTKRWEDHSRDNSRFNHMQHIYSAYLGYLIRLNKFGIKSGVRAEGTALNADYAKKPAMNFKTDYFDVVPNVTFTYQIDMASQIRIGYNMRIQRPGIWYLNPYINDINPENISQGNPNLDSEKSNNINLNFSKFTQKFSVNASMNYSFVNNSIEKYSFIARFPADDIRSQYNGALWNTYGNIGQKQQVGLFLYGNWSPAIWFRFYINGGIDYTMLKANSLDMKNNGFSGRFYAGPQFTLPKDFRIYVNGGYFSSRVQLQGKMSSFYFVGLGVSKDFLNKKLSVSLNAHNPFWKNIKMEMKTTGKHFENRWVNWRVARDFSLSVSYRFGTMKGQIKKARRGINNDDLKSGGENNTGGGQEQQGT